MKTRNEGLESFVAWAGNASEAARRIDKSRTHMSQMRSGKRRVTPELAKLIEQVSGGKVRKAALRPDLWGRK